MVSLRTCACLASEMAGNRTVRFLCHVRPTAPASPQVVRRSPRLLRKRGPRSCCAPQRRYSKFVYVANSLHGFSSSSTVSPTSTDVSRAPCTSLVSPTCLDVSPDFSSSFSVLHVNIRGWRSHVDELAAYVELLPQKPSFIAVNETFLNRSVKVELPGYVVAGRRDRFSSETNPCVDNLQTFGGVLLLAAQEYDGSLVEVLRSDTAERLWFVLHCNVGPVLLCVWYRPPCPGDISAISTFNDELQCLRDDAICILFWVILTVTTNVGYVFLRMFLRKGVFCATFALRTVFRKKFLRRREGSTCLTFV